MRILTIIFILLSHFASGSKYYISNAGSDAADGLTTSTAWQTISKVNTSAVSGDTILFRCGDTWFEKLIVPASNIYFGSYGIGVKPVISGFITLSGFSNVGNIWSKTIPSGANKLITVMIDGRLRAKEVS